MKATYYLTFIATGALIALGLGYLFFMPPNDYWQILLLGGAFNGFLCWKSYQQLKDTDSNNK